jgi:hypothetical protein
MTRSLRRPSDAPTAACGRSANSPVAARQTALILTRALLSIVGRSLYLVAPEDPTERKRRFDSARRSWAEQALSILDKLAAAGFEPADDRERIARIAEATEARGVPRLPTDRDLLSALGLDPYYARVYTLASDVAHYSIGTALGGFLQYPDRLTGSGEKSHLGCATTRERWKHSRWPRSSTASSLSDASP